MGSQRNKIDADAIENIFDMDIKDLLDNKMPAKLPAKPSFKKECAVLRLGGEDAPQATTPDAKLPKSVQPDPVMKAAAKVEQMVNKISAKDPAIKSDIKVPKSKRVDDDHKPSGFFLDNALSMAGKRTAPWDR